MIHHLFDLGTGLFTGRTMSASAEILAANCPEGFAWAAGVVDWQSQRVDLDQLAAIAKLREEQRNEIPPVAEATEGLIRAIQEQHLVVPYIPPSPGPDYEWSAERKRWRIRSESAQREAKSRAARSEIERLELKMLRPLRELELARLAGTAPDTEAAAKLEQIEARIGVLRADL